MRTLGNRSYYAYRVNAHVLLDRQVTILSTSFPVSLFFPSLGGRVDNTILGTRLCNIRIIKLHVRYARVD